MAASSKTNLVELEDFLPTNSPELGAIIDDDSDWSGEAKEEFIGESIVEFGKNEEAWREATCGETDGEAEIEGSVVKLRDRELDKKEIMKTNADNLVVVAMKFW